jgi:hypothetical protein
MKTTQNRTNEQEQAFIASKLANGWTRDVNPPSPVVNDESTLPPVALSNVISIPDFETGLPSSTFNRDPSGSWQLVCRDKGVRFELNRT